MSTATHMFAIACVVPVLDIFIKVILTWSKHSDKNRTFNFASQSFFVHDNQNNEINHIKNPSLNIESIWHKDQSNRLGNKSQWNCIHHPFSWPDKGDGLMDLSPSHTHTPPHIHTVTGNWASYIFFKSKNLLPFRHLFFFTRRISSVKHCSSHFTPIFYLRSSQNWIVYKIKFWTRKI